MGHWWCLDMAVLYIGHHGLSLYHIHYNYIYIIFTCTTKVESIVLRKCRPVSCNSCSLPNNHGPYNVLKYQRFSPFENQIKPRSIVDIFALIISCVDKPLIYCGHWNIDLFLDGINSVLYLQDNLTLFHANHATKYCLWFGLLYFKWQIRFAKPRSASKIN